MLSGISEVYQDLIMSFIFAVPIIMALTNAIKEIFELDGKINMAVSFGVGIVLSGMFAVSYFVPSSKEIVAVVFFILSSGLVSSGFYSFSTRLRDGDEE